MILGGMGVVFAIFSIALFNIKNVGFPAFEILLYYAIYLSGCIIALIIILRISTMKVLTLREE
jgi:hypothetical protein